MLDVLVMMGGEDEDEGGDGDERMGTQSRTAADKGDEDCLFLFRSLSLSFKVDVVCRA